MRVLLRLSRHLSSDLGEKDSDTILTTAQSLLTRGFRRMAICNALRPGPAPVTHSTRSRAHVLPCLRAMSTSGPDNRRICDVVSPM
jgi:hypothetical protein